MWKIAESLIVDDWNVVGKRVQLVAAENIEM